MDRSEGALRVAEKAIRNTQDVATKVAELRQLLADNSSLKGERGDVGQAGVGIDKIVVSDDGFGSILLTDGRIFDLGRIRGHDGRDGRDGRDGPAGRSIVATKVEADGRLVISFNDGSHDIAGMVVGPAGKDGRDGANGADGRDGKSVRGERGPAGEAGAKGDRGPAGKDGRDGADGSTIAFGASHPFDTADIDRLRVVEMIDDTGEIRRILTLD